MTNEKASDVILGLDLGSNSIGWALIAGNTNARHRMLASGVRVFEAGVEGDFASGRGEPRGKARREARQHRRMLERRKRRLRKLLNILTGAGLLSSGPAKDTISELDKTLYARHIDSLSVAKPEKKRASQVLPYILRAKALDEKLEPFEIGRALYHLAQRRGFLSNRKVPQSDKKEAGAVKKGIEELRDNMTQTGARTLGEYFASLNPHEQRIRGRWTARAMFENEFECIWSAQQEYYPELLTDELKQRINHAMFHQRPLKNQADLIGTCELEAGHKRTPWALLAAQRFRLVQQVNNTRLITPDGEDVQLTADQRQTLLDLLENQGEMTFGKARKKLGLSSAYHFSWEAGGEKRFLGNRTNAKLAATFGDRWKGLSTGDRRRIVEDILSIQNNDALARRAVCVWGLDEDVARKLARVELEPRYCRLSRKALCKLLPLLESGLSYAEAVKEAYGEFHRKGGVVDCLPSVSRVLPQLRNPVVNRVLTELRKVVNAIIQRHGKPGLIRLELARDMRKSPKQRQQATQRNRRNEKDRAAAAQKITTEASIEHPSRDDIEKVLLANECNWECPYTGRRMSMASLLGANPQFDVEHIIPFSRCLNNSFINKTLCYHEENRNVKRNRTPFEAYGADPERWDEITERVKGFTGTAAREKLRRFLIQETEGLEGFIDQQLNDTRYATREAIKYLGLLYGGTVDHEGRLRVQATRGATTAYLRDAWDLNRILGDGGTKSRHDHRHHAVDAIVIALTKPNAIRQLSHAARRELTGRVKFDDVKPPWDGFVDHVRQSVNAINVSRRACRKVNGPLHEETFYGPVEPDEDGNPTAFHVRKPLAALSAKEATGIVDPKVRQVVLDALNERGGSPKTAFAKPEQHPYIETRDGRRIPIHRVRIRTSVAAFQVGKDPRTRFVLSKTNHHAEIFELLDKKGQKKWVARIVSRYQAMRRLVKGEQVVKCEHDGGGRFVFSLAPGETIEIDEQDGKRALFIVRVVSQKKTGGVEFECVHVNDARKKADIRANHASLRKTPNKLAELNCRKVTVHPLGEVRWAND